MEQWDVPDTCYYIAVWYSVLSEPFFDLHFICAVCKILFYMRLQMVIFEMPIIKWFVNTGACVMLIVEQNKSHFKIYYRKYVKCVHSSYTGSGVACTAEFL
jgi:hypothetical protein